jgi:hypothetical protein
MPVHANLFRMGDGWTGLPTLPGRIAFGKFRFNSPGSAGLRNTGT